MLKLTEPELDWICERIPDPVRDPRGGRPPLDKRMAVAGIFWVLDNGAKWKDLPSEYGSKSAVHRWFKRWVEAGVFEAIMRDAGSCVEEQGGYRLYECFIDATFAKAKGGGDGVGLTKVGKGVKIMVLVDARGLPVAVDTAPANRSENRLAARGANGLSWRPEQREPTRESEASRSSSKPVGGVGGDERADAAVGSR